MAWGQNGEDEIITRYFEGFTGHLLDIGAASGKELSNSYELLLRGWHGVMVEASIGMLPALIKNMEGLKAEIINEVTSTKAGWVDWYESGGDFLSTTKVEQTQIWNQVQFKKVLRYQIHWMALRERYKEGFDFISIDTEGTSAELFLDMFENFPETRLWCIEHDGRKDEIITKAQGFNVLCQNGENIIIAK